MKFDKKVFRDKIGGCWYGKTVGGTIGMPFEWKRQKNNVEFYTQDLSGAPVANDDLDIQLLWLIALEKHGFDLDANVLAYYWQSFLAMHCAEYGISRANMQCGLMPPLSGEENNPFKDSCGAYIRSEIWACVFAGQPDLAARFAYEDAVLDHGGANEGVYAAIFCAVMESSAFIESDLRKLIEIGLSYIPKNCILAKAIGRAVECFDRGLTYFDAREIILQEFRGQSCGVNSRFGVIYNISEEDKKKSYEEGVRGFDAPSNIAFIVMALLYSKGDFSDAVCIATNLGEDTDCTAATVGAILGIVNGKSEIPQKWLAPIGNKITVACINVVDLPNLVPDTVDELTDRTIELFESAMKKYNFGTYKDSPVYDFFEHELTANDYIYEQLYKHIGCVKFDFPFYTVSLCYENGCRIKNGERKKIVCKIVTKSFLANMLEIKWYHGENVAVLPSDGGVIYAETSHAIANKEIELEYEIECLQISKKERLVLEITLAGRCETMLVPVILLDGNMKNRVDYGY